MSRRGWLVLPLLMVAIGDRTDADEAAAVEKKVSDIAGAWSGDWGGFDPATATALDKEKCKSLECRVVRSGSEWQATFEGECGRPYKYTITMQGRESDGVVLFRGSVDLGAKDGGVHDWIGRANDKSFVGFYTSSHHTGLFRLTRPKAATEKPGSDA